MATVRTGRLFFFFKELARADGGLDWAAGGRCGSFCGQEMIFNKLGEVRLGRNVRPRQGTTVLHGQRCGWRQQEGGQQAEAGS